MEPTRTRRHPNGEKISETEIISSLPYSEEEREKLRLAVFQKNSNDLVNLEVEAFNAMEGKFKDNNGEYTVIGEPESGYGHSPSPLARVPQCKTYHHVTY